MTETAFLRHNVQRLLNPASTFPWTRTITPNLNLNQIGHSYIILLESPLKFVNFLKAMIIFCKYYESLVCHCICLSLNMVLFTCKTNQKYLDVSNVFDKELRFLSQNIQYLSKCTSAKMIQISLLQNLSGNIHMFSMSKWHLIAAVIFCLIFTYMMLLVFSNKELQIV